MKTWSAKLISRDASPKAQHRVRLEAGLACLVIASAVWVAWRFRATGHLPQPFQADPSLSLMDFFNTAYWANRGGAYTVWHSVYPPVSFVFVRLWTAPACYRATALVGRDCDPRAMLSMLAFFMANIVLVFASFRKAHIDAGLMRTVALCAGLPMLYSLERGNLIIPCFTAYVLAEGGLVRYAPIRYLLLATSINFKPYLAFTFLPLLVRRQWKRIAALALAGLVVYLTTYAFEREGSPLAMWHSLLSYVHGEANLYADHNHLAAISARSFGLWNALFLPLTRLGQIGIAACYLVALLRPERLPMRRMIALSISGISSEAALHTIGYAVDYTQIFLLFFIFLDEWSGVEVASILIPAYLLCVSADYMVTPVFHAFAWSYFGKQTVSIDYGVTIGQFARPALLIAIQYSLIASLLWRRQPSAETGAHAAQAS